MTILNESASTRLSALLNKPATGKLITSEHRRVLGTICDEVKQAGVPVEQLIVALKNVLDRFPAAADEPAARLELRERLIGVCIEEYYRDGDGVSPRIDGVSLNGDGISMNGDGLPATAAFPSESRKPPRSR